MKSLNQLARAAYSAHYKRKHHTNNIDAVVSAWLALSAEQQACWIEAARAVYEEVKHLH